MNKSVSVRRLTLSAMLLAAGMLLPFLTGQIQHIGNMLLPMHLPVFICGMVCGPMWGFAVGMVLPLLRSIVFGMPVLVPAAVCMAFELAAYGMISGLLRSRLPKTLPMLFVALITAMLLGRLVWGAVSAMLLTASGKGFTWAAFAAGAFVNAVPGIVLHILLIPVLVMALERALPWMKR